MIVEQLWQWIQIAINNTKIEVSCTLLVFICVLLLVRCFQYLTKHRCPLPPGPRGMPIIGYLFKAQRSYLPLHLQYCELAKKHGPIFSVKLGTELVVVLADYKHIRDAFKHDAFTGRPHTAFYNILGGYGIINTDGKMWKEQRKFLQQKLSSFGMTFGNGKEQMESRIMSEVTLFLRMCAYENGKPINISSALGISVSNVICTLIMGVRFHHGEEQFKRFMSLIEEGFKLFAIVDNINYIPLIKYLPSQRNVRNKIAKNRAEMAQFFQDLINKERRTFHINNKRHLVDYYLIESEQAKQRGEETKLFQGKDHDGQIQQILGDLFSAGMETIKTTLEWGVLLMLHHPDAAMAVQEELDRVVGRSRMPTLNDRKKLPITEATIQEILRRTSIVPLGTTHATTRTVDNFHGYRIPANSQVVPLLYAIHMDPELWEDPESFKPSRFLINDDEGVKVFKPDYFMPFGVGKRSCLGIILAQMEIFLYFSSLMHTFDLRLPENASLPSLQGNVGVTISPRPFHVCLLVRKPNLIGNLDDNNEIIDGPLRNVGGH